MMKEHTAYKCLLQEKRGKSCPPSLPSEMGVQLLVLGKSVMRLTSQTYTTFTQLCKITQRSNIRRANTCDPALKLLNEEIMRDHKYNTHIIWTTIHGISNRAPPTTLNNTIAFNNKITTTSQTIHIIFKHYQASNYTKYHSKNTSNYTHQITNQTKRLTSITPTPRFKTIFKNTRYTTNINTNWNH